MKYVINKDADGIETIVLDNLDGSVSYIPSDPANSDYQAYLESLEPKAKAPKVVDEAAPL
jgi:hypothetical protein